MRTRVGYAGGSTANPTYHDLADHTEVFQLDFDATQLSYGALLDEIWANRRGGRSYSRQYMDAIFVANAEQERIAKDRVGDRAPIITGAQFWLAEDYHQKYYLRHDSVLMRELADYSDAELVESTLAARLNGVVGSRGARGLGDEIERLGLSSTARAHLEKLVARRA